MAHPSAVGNPFLMMLSPEVVLAAVESSEHLSRLERRTCRPLDRHVAPGAPADDATRHDEATTVESEDEH